MNALVELNHTRRPASPLGKLMKPGAIDGALGRAVGLLCQHSFGPWPPHDSESLLLGQAQAIVALCRHAEGLAELMRDSPPKAKTSAGRRAWPVAPPNEEVADGQSV